MASLDLKRVSYRGPAQQVCYEMPENGYSPILVPDAVYELPAEFAERLLASNPHFQAAPPRVFKSSRLKDASKLDDDSVSETPSEEENE